MERKTAVILSIGIITTALTAFALAKKKPYVASAIMGSFGAFGLIYTLLVKEEVDQIRASLGPIQT